MRHILPLGAFILLVALLGFGLTLDPRKVPSVLIDKPAPLFELVQLHQPDQTISTTDMKGKVWMLNVWASWCGACRQEHPLLVELARKKVIEIVGLDYKDETGAALQWLKQFGDPYSVIAYDGDGRAGIDWGVYGVPETFIIDKQGFIRHKQIGPLTPESLEKTILPLINKLKEEA